MKCYRCKKQFDKPDIDVACGEAICPSCRVHLPQGSFIVYDVEMNCLPNYWET